MGSKVCTHCQGRGTRRVPVRAGGLEERECTVCCGLKTLGDSEWKMPRRDYRNETTITMHSAVDPYEIIALLPEGEPDE